MVYIDRFPHSPTFYLDHFHAANLHIFELILKDLENGGSSSYRPFAGYSVRYASESSHEQKQDLFRFTLSKDFEQRYRQVYTQKMQRLG
jgi:hypothetical protein